MTSYTGLVTLVQLSASAIGDKNPVSYSIGMSVIRNVLQATERLREDPHDLDGRGIILCGASIPPRTGWALAKKVATPTACTSWSSSPKCCSENHTARVWPLSSRAS